MVLKGNQGQRKTGRFAEPELKGNVQFGTSHGRGFSRESSRVSNHDVVGISQLSGLREFLPQCKELAVMLVDRLASNLDFNVVNQDLTDTAGPCGGTGTCESGESDFQVDLPDQVTVAGDLCRNFLSKVHSSIKRLLNGFNGKVGVSTVDTFEESDLGVTGQV